MPVTAVTVAGVDILLVLAVLPEQAVTAVLV
jgi:hypothetical protein